MIKNTIYNSPTKIYFGKGEENNINKIINEYGFKNILIIYGQNSVIKSGLLKRVTDQLKDVKVSLKGGVEPNPKVSFVTETNEQFKNEKFDFILAIGGGSVIDTAKGIAVTIEEQIDPLDILNNKITIGKAIPIGTILTLSASGSELSSSCVLSDLSLQLKKGFNSDLIRPVFSIMNPELTYSVSKYQTANGIVDILMHTLERFFNPNYNFQFTQEVSIGILKTVIDNAREAYNNPTNYDARANLMIAGSFSHNDITNIGIDRILRVHQFEHILSAYRDDISHGEGLAVLFIAWAKVMKEYYINELSLLAVRLFNCENNISKDLQADFFISQLQNLFIEIGMAKNLRELNIKEEELTIFTNLLTNNKQRTIDDAVTIDFDLAYKIFEVAY